VKVFILAGQSNMEGHGVIEGPPGKPGTLAVLARDPATAARYRHLLDAEGNWVVRDDVFLAWNDAGAAWPSAQDRRRHGQGDGGAARRPEGAGQPDRSRVKGA
jgi:hypothetical protein